MSVKHVRRTTPFRFLWSTFPTLLQYTHPYFPCDDGALLAPIWEAIVSTARKQHLGRGNSSGGLTLLVHMMPDRGALHRTSLSSTSYSKNFFVCICIANDSSKTTARSGPDDTTLLHNLNPSGDSINRRTA